MTEEKKTTKKETAPKKEAAPKKKVEHKTHAPKREMGAFEKFKKKMDQKAKESRGWAIGITLGWAFLMLLWVFAVLIGTQYWVAFLLLGMNLPVSETVLQTIFTAITYTVSLVLIILVPWKVLGMKTTRDEIGMRGLPTWTDVLLAPIGFIVFMIVASFALLVMQAIMPTIDWNQAQDVGFSGMYGQMDFILAFICLVIIAPLVEEMIFRGWLYGKMRSKMSALPAILLVSLLFGIVHGQWNVGVVVFVMSIAMCAIRELTGTIWGGMLIHVLKNAVAFYALFVNPSFGGAAVGALLLAL